MGPVEWRSLSLSKGRLLFHRFKVGIRFIWIKHLVAIHHRHEILRFRKVDDVVRISRKHVDGFNLVPGDLPFQNLTFRIIEVPLLDEAVALDHDELLEFGVVLMLPFRDAGLRDVDGHLTGIVRMDQFGEGAAVIDIHLQGEGHLLLGKIAQVRGIQLLGEASGRALRDHQCLRLLSERMQQVHDLAEGRPVRRGHVAVLAVLDREHAQTVEVAAVLLPLQAADHLVHQVVDVQQFQLHRRIIDRIRKVIGNGVAEGCDGGSVVGPAPLAEEVREAVHQHLRASFLAVLEEQVLAGLLAAAILGVPEAARQRRLLGARQHDRAGVPMGLEGIQQGRCEPEIPLHELSGVLGPIHSCEVEHKVRFGAPAIQFLGRGVEVVFIYFRDGNAVVAGPTVTDVFKLCAEVSSYEAFGASNKYYHRAEMLLEHLLNWS